MVKEIDIKISFCPKCKEERSNLQKYCGRCGSKLMIQPIIICMDGDEVTRVLRS